MSDYTIIWFPEAVHALYALPTRTLTDVLNNVALLVADPYPPHAKVRSEIEGLYSLRIGNATVTYDVLGSNTVRILMVASVSR